MRTLILEMNVATQPHDLPLGRSSKNLQIILHPKKPCFLLRLILTLPDSTIKRHLITMHPKLTKVKESNSFGTKKLQDTHNTKESTIKK